MARDTGNNSKPGKKAGVTILKPEAEGDIPPMPDPREWIDNRELRQELGIDEPVEWHPAVVEWWHDIWSSPMANEFVNSDVHGLYIGCYFLHESLDPYYKLSERIQAAKLFESVVKNFGLNPSARESLKWQVAQGTAAQKRTDQIRETSPKQTANKQTADDTVQELYRRNG